MWRRWPHTFVWFIRTSATNRKPKFQHKNANKYFHFYNILVAMKKAEGCLQISLKPQMNVYPINADSFWFLTVCWGGWGRGGFHPSFSETSSPLYARIVDNASVDSDISTPAVFCIKLILAENKIFAARFWWIWLRTQTSSQLKCKWHVVLNKCFLLTSPVFGVPAENKHAWIIKLLRKKKAIKFSVKIRDSQCLYIIVDSFVDLINTCSSYHVFLSTT